MHIILASVAYFNLLALTPRAMLDELTKKADLPPIKLTYAVDGCLPSKVAIACAFIGENHINYKPDTLAKQPLVNVYFTLAHEVGHLMPGYIGDASAHQIEEARANKNGLSLIGATAYRESRLAEKYTEGMIANELAHLTALDPPHMVRLWLKIKKEFFIICDTPRLEHPPIIILEYPYRSTETVVRLDTNPTITVTLWDVMDGTQNVGSESLAAKIYALGMIAKYREALVKSQPQEIVIY